MSYAERIDDARLDHLIRMQDMLRSRMTSVLATDDGFHDGNVHAGVYRALVELKQLRHGLAEAQENADTYRQERDDISGNYQRLERRSLELVRGGANLLRELAEARELLDQVETVAVNDKSGCTSCTRVVNLIVAATPTPSAEVPK